MRILVTRLRFLGDIVLSTPLLDTLRERWPEASIEYLGADPHVQVLEGHPSVDRIHRLPSRPSVSDLWRVVGGLRSGEKIDWAIDLFSNPRSALLVGLSGARHRVGSDRGLRSRVYQYRRGRPDGSRSAVRHHLDKLVPMLGEMPPERPTRLVPVPGRRERVLAALGLEPDTYMMIHPGSTWPEKAWPRERWAQLLGAIDSGRCGTPLVVSPPGDEDAADEVARASGARRLPPLSIGDLSVLVSGARLYVGNDGGVMHMAVAHAVPTVALFGPTEPDIWFPYESWGPFRVIHDCGPERRDDRGRQLSRLDAIGIDSVSSVIDDVLGLERRAGSS